MKQINFIGKLTRNFNKKSLNGNNLQKRFFSRSYLDLTSERDNQILDKLQNGSNFSAEEIGEFARVLKKQGGNSEIFKKFEAEMLGKINQLNELDLRKIISLIISENNKGYLRSDVIIDSLGDKLDLIYTNKDRNGITLEEFKKNKRNFLRNQPAANKFWIYLYSLRIKALGAFKNFGIFAK